LLIDMLVIVLCLLLRLGGSDSLGRGGRGRHGAEGGSGEGVVVASRQLGGLGRLLGLLGLVLRENEVPRSSDDGDGHNGSAHQRREEEVWEVERERERRDWEGERRERRETALVGPPFACNFQLQNASKRTQSSHQRQRSRSEQWWSLQR